MIYRTFRPGFPLSQFVDHFWHYEGYTPEHDKEKVLPDGSMELIIDLQDGGKRLFSREDPERSVVFRGSWLSGQHREHILIESGKHSSMMGIHFRPGGVHPFFPFPMSEINDTVVALDAVWGREADRLRERLLEQPTCERRFSLLQGHLLRKADSMAQDRALAAALEWLTAKPAESVIEHVAWRAGVSQRSLLRRFDLKVGLKPKLLSRVFKFQRVVSEIEAGRPIQWADLAYRCGYFDQAHFIKEFKAFSGMNPSRYLVERGDFVNFVPVR